RLRGETPRASFGHLSQPADRGLEAGHRDGTDFSGELRITEWIRRSRSTCAASSSLPTTGCGGSRSRTPSATPTSAPRTSRSWPREPVVATEKIHGAACLFTFVAESGEGFVSSKDQGAQNLWRSPSPTTTCTGRR